ncbi:hypothetical protein BsIDN1_06310 [Bacillus safensis]|uniref:Uncharacterized protein n=1 Tax=Bacillus safensis TaxID=561879 RepID=A0A5S9M1J1_BACIA|nr:hypothetical protein BsIDN1_06310 [Bacillus safensis]
MMKVIRPFVQLTVNIVMSRGIDHYMAFQQSAGMIVTNGQWRCAKEGGTGASVKYVRPSDNRGAGSWVSHQLSDDPDGTRIQFIID